MEENFEKEINDLGEKHKVELEEKKNQYSQRMLEDAARYQNLVDAHEDEQRRFHAVKMGLFESHTEQVN